MCILTFDLIHSFRAKSTSVEKDSAALGAGRKRSRFGEQMPQHAIPPPQVASGEAAALATPPAAASGAAAAPTGGQPGMTPGMYLQVRISYKLY